MTFTDRTILFLVLGMIWMSVTLTQVRVSALTQQCEIRSKP